MLVGEAANCRAIGIVYAARGIEGSKTCKAVLIGGSGVPSVDENRSKAVMTRITQTILIITPSINLSPSSNG